LAFIPRGHSFTGAPAGIGGLARIAIHAAGFPPFRDEGDGGRFKAVALCTGVA